MGILLDGAFPSDKRDVAQWPGRAIIEQTSIDSAGTHDYIASSQNRSLSPLDGALSWRVA